MINQEYRNTVRQDVSKVKQDLGTLEGASATQLSRYEGTVSKATEEFSNWVDDSVSNLGEGIGKLTDNVKESVVNYTTAVKKDVGHGLSRYNAKIQEIAEKVPGDFSYKVDRNPWVAISITLVLGLLVGVILKPSRRSLG